MNINYPKDAISSVSSLEGFFRILKLLNQHLPTIKNETFLFRGVGDSNWEMIPGLFRKLPKSGYKYGSTSIQGNVFNSSKQDNSILDTFKRSAIGYITNIDYNDHFRWMTYAQHFGVPTRMLDFSLNPLVALYFACCDYDNGKDGLVWSIHRNNYNNWFRQGFEGNSNYFTDSDVIDFILTDMGYSKDNGLNKKFTRPFIRPVPHVDRRMVAQGSIFMIWTSNKDSIDDLITDINFYSYKSDILYDIKEDIRFLSVMKIESESKYRIILELNQVGINSATLFPGLDGVGEHIRELARRDPRDYKL